MSSGVSGKVRTELRLRRGTILALISAILLAGGIVCFIQKARVSGGSRDSDTSIYAGAALLLLAATSATLSLPIFRRGCRQLQARLDELTANGKLTAVDTTATPLVPLVRSINDLIHY